MEEGGTCLLVLSDENDDRRLLVFKKPIIGSNFFNFKIYNWKLFDARAKHG